MEDKHKVPDFNIVQIFMDKHKGCLNNLRWSMENRDYEVEHQFLWEDKIGSTKFINFYKIGERYVVFDDGELKELFHLKEYDEKGMSYTEDHLKLLSVLDYEVIIRKQ